MAGTRIRITVGTDAIEAETLDTPTAAAVRAHFLLTRKRLQPAPPPADPLCGSTPEDTASNWALGVAGRGSGPVMPTERKLL